MEGEFSPNPEKLDPVRGSGINDSQRGVSPSRPVVNWCPNSVRKRMRVQAGMGDSNLALKTPNRLARTASETGFPAILAPPEPATRG